MGRFARMVNTSPAASKSHVSDDHAPGAETQQVLCRHIPRAVVLEAHHIAPSYARILRPPVQQHHRDPSPVQQLDHPRVHLRAPRA
jgi:hypothetical protein